MEEKKINFEFRYSTGQYEYINASAELTIDEAVEMRKVLDSTEGAWNRRSGGHWRGSSSGPLRSDQGRLLSSGRTVSEICILI